MAEPPLEGFSALQPGSAFTDDSVLSVALAEAILEGSDYAGVMRLYGRRYPKAG